MEKSKGEPMPHESEESFEKVHDIVSTISSEHHDSDQDSIHHSSTSAQPPLTKSTSRATAKSTKSNIITRTVSRLTARSGPVEYLPPPDGGTTAWFQCFLTFLVMFNTWGFVNSFGAFQTYYTSTDGLALPQSTISWIGSVQAFFMWFLSVFSGRALDAGLFRPVVITGVVCQVLGMFLLSLSTKYWQIFLTQGVMTGIGGGLYFCPSMGLLSTYFARRRGIATGLATTGNAVGGIVFPLVVRELLPKIGFAWTARVLAFIILATLSVVVALAKPRMPPRKAGPIVEWRAIYDTPYVFFVFGICSLMMGVYFVYYYIGSFARDAINMPYDESLNLVIILNGVGVPARVFPGLLADRFGPLNVFIPLVFTNVVLLYGWTGVKEINSFYAFTVLFGFFCAAVQSMFPLAICSLDSDLTKTGTRLGMACSVIGFAALCGGPIGGALLTTDHGGYLPSQIWAASMMLLGLCLCFGARWKKFGFSYGGRC